MLEHRDLTNRIIGLAIEVHRIGQNFTATDTRPAARCA
jgi:hypothetical protein